MGRSSGRLARAAGDPIFEQYREAFASETTPRAAVYVGAGASHSWLWFADLLERIGIYDIAFIDEAVVLTGGLAGFDMLLVGGGDTYAMAEALGSRGARALADFVEGGGFYMGSCAGAYLVLSGVDLPPFTPFSLIDGDMLNVMPDPPPPLCLAHKYLAPYGEEWVFHPVYGEVLLSPESSTSGFPCFRREGALRTVLFGGPIMEAGNDEEVAAVFSGLTGRAAFLWPEVEAERLVKGKAAAISTRRGRGSVLASGPHLEHPLFPRSNALASEHMLRHWRSRLEGGLSEGLDRGLEGGPQGPLGPGLGDPERSGDVGALVLAIKREVSNARIVAFGLEKMPVTWRIGVKVWEPEKVRMFMESAWRRLAYMNDNAGFIVDTDGLEVMAAEYGDVTLMVKSLKIKVESGEDSLAEAVSLLTTLKELTARFLSLYFRLRSEECIEREKTPLMMEL